MKKIFTPLFAVFTIYCTNVTAQTATKKVFLEEFTTTLCGNCPPQSHVVNDWHENNESKSVLMTHHAGFGVDSLTTTEATTICNIFSPSTFGFAPAVMIDRDVYPWLDSVPYMTVNGFDTVATRVSNNPAPASVDIQGTYNSITRSLSVTATTSFVSNVANGNYRLCIYLVEDSVIGVGNGYDQKCYDATFANTYYSGHFNSSTHLIDTYAHRMVERKSLSGGVWGSAGIIPSSPVQNTPYSVTGTFTVPSKYNDSRLYIVAYLALQGASKVDRNVLNANDIKVTANFGTTATAVLETENPIHINSIYPNPTTDYIGIAFTSKNGGMTSVSVIDIFGRTVMTPSEEINLSAGNYERFLNVSSLESGIYFLVLKSGNEISTQRFIVER